MKINTWLLFIVPSQPEKKNPGLTPMDWVKLLISAVVGLVSFRCVFHSHVLFGVFEQCIIMNVLVCLELTQLHVWSAILQFLWSFFFSAITWCFIESFTTFLLWRCYLSLAGGLGWITRGGKCWCMGGFGNPWWHHWLYCKNLFHVCAFKLSARMVTCVFYVEDTVFIASKDWSLQSSKWFFSSIYLIPSQELFKAHFVLNHHALKKFSMLFLSHCFHMWFFSSSSSFCFFFMFNPFSVF